MRGTGLHPYKINFDLGSVYIRDNLLFCYLEAKNKSNVGYDIDFIRFYIRDRKSACRKAVQETQVVPRYIFPAEPNTIPGHYRIYGLTKFTIPDQKLLVVEIFEKDRGRVMAFKMRNRQLINAGVLP